MVLQSGGGRLLPPPQVPPLLPRPLHQAKEDPDEEVEDLEAAHDGEAGEEAEGAADHRDLRHRVRLGVLRDLVQG